MSDTIEHINQEVLNGFTAQFLFECPASFAMSDYSVRISACGTDLPAQEGINSASILATTPAHRRHVMPATFRMTAQLRLRKCQP